MDQTAILSIMFGTTWLLIAYLYYRSSNLDDRLDLYGQTCDYNNEQLARGLKYVNDSLEKLIEELDK